MPLRIGLRDTPPQRRRAEGLSIAVRTLRKGGTHGRN